MEWGQTFKNMKKSELYNIIKGIIKELGIGTPIKNTFPCNTINSEPPKGDTFMSSPVSCPSTNPYGTLKIYMTTDTAGECETVQETNDSFICCSSTNSSDNDTPTGTLFSIPYDMDDLVIQGNQGQCYYPSGDYENCLGEGVTQFTIQDLAWFYYYYGGGGSAYLPWCDSGGEMNNDGSWTGNPACNFNWFNLGNAEYTDCAADVGGCPHPLSTEQSDGVGAYVDTSEGCLDGTGAPMTTFPDSISCCRFTGCGSVAGNVSANNLGVWLEGTYENQIPETTNALGTTFTAIDPNDEYAFWVDDQTCEFDAQCTNETITLNNIVLNTDAIGFSTVTGSNFYDGVGLSGGTCTVTTCADDGLLDFNDPLGTGIPTTNFAVAGCFTMISIISSPLNGPVSPKKVFIPES